MRRWTRGALAGVPLALVLALGGCGSDGDGGGVATAGGDKNAGGGGGGGEQLSPDERNLKFVQCLREHGLKVDDPEPGKGVMLKFGPNSGVDRATVEKAMQACRRYAPQQMQSANPQQQENARKYAACMRENGVEAFPDPEPGQMGIRITPEVGEDPDFEKAQQACRDILPGGGPQGGGGGR
ncbi:hypothetical protein [Thermomonospora cellulosilytica]|uniref:Lipoprotein n=1 Tax=Thermomonospora cellulosilytica TaxID=1411118 RepID=A0A7W3R8U7_9ACTN|nr:hypothetical protein [Thermomonospora cellulosilytica]MBA9003974.1 hypothetical protein [Thermomonospora cellulosilytica]